VTNGLFVRFRKRYLGLPFQAIPARLANVQPVQQVFYYFSAQLIFAVIFSVKVFVIDTTKFCWPMSVVAWISDVVYFVLAVLVE